MSKRKYDEMWEILSKYQFEIDGDTAVDVLCVLCKKILVNASQVSCGCRYCKNCIDKYLEDGPKKCIGTKQECNEDLLSLGDIQTDHRANLLVSTLTVQCVKAGCSVKTELGQMNEHFVVCNGTVNECLYNSIGCDASMLSSENMSAHLEKDIIIHTRLLTEWIGNVRNELCENNKRFKVLEDEITMLKGQIESQANLIDSQRREIETRQQSVASIDSRPNDIANKLNILTGRLDNISAHISNDSDFIWKVEGMKEKVDDARTGVRAVILSEPFYTHKHGYKMRLSMHPNGYGHNEGTHLYVLFCVMKGDYDDLLPWPLTRSVTLGIIDRNTGGYYCSYRFRFEDTDRSFRGSFMRPISNMNMAMGNDEFVRLDALFKYQNLLRDDSLFIKCALGH